MNAMAALPTECGRPSPICPSAYGHLLSRHTTCTMRMVDSWFSLRLMGNISLFFSHDGDKLLSDRSLDWCLNKMSTEVALMTDNLLRHLDTTVVDDKSFWWLLLELSSVCS